MTMCLLEISFRLLPGKHREFSQSVGMLMGGKGEGHRKTMVYDERDEPGRALARVLVLARVDPAAVAPGDVAGGAPLWPRVTGRAAVVQDPAGLAERDLRLVRDGMFAVVNEAGGTANIARLPDPKIQMAGKTGSAQVRRVSREQREQGFHSENLPWEYRPHALFVAAQHTRPLNLRAAKSHHGRACPGRPRLRNKTGNTRMGR